MTDFSRRAVTVLEIDLDSCSNTYGIAPCTASGAAGTECYNTFKTCQDTPNFTKTTVTHKFCSRGAPFPSGELIRPYLSGQSFAPTEIDLERGLGRRASASITLVDDTAPDTLTEDPYRATRAAPATGTWLARLIARNHNAAGREARVRRAYLAGAWNWSDFVDEAYIIESLKGPDSRGNVSVVLKDPIKLTDRRKIPEPSNGKLAVDLTATDLKLTLGTGQGADYPASGFVRVRKEIIEYTDNTSDVLSWPSVANRAQFNTTAGEASVNETVQICKAWENAPASEVVEDLLTESGIALADIDTTGMATEEADWFGPSFNITTAIATPEDASKLLEDYLTLVGAYVWWDPVAQKVKFEVLAPLKPTETPADTLTDAAHFVLGSVNVSRRDDLRTTVRALFYDLESPVADQRERSSFRRAQVFIDADAESANEYNDRRTKTRLARWWGNGNDAAALAVVSRRSAYYRDPPIEIEARLAAKDAARREGDQVDVETVQLADVDGSALTTPTIITRRRDEGGEISVRLRSTGLGLRYGFIGSDLIGDYPSDPDYAHIAPDAGFSDGSDYYRIF